MRKRRIRVFAGVLVVGLGVLAFAVWAERLTAGLNPNLTLPNYPSVFLLNRSPEVDETEIQTLVRMLKHRYVRLESDRFYAANIIIVDEGDRWAVSMQIPGSGDFRSRIPFGVDSARITMYDGRSIEYYSKDTLEIQAKIEGDLVYAPLESDLNLDENF